MKQQVDDPIPAAVGSLDSVMAATLAPFPLVCSRATNSSGVSIGADRASTCIIPAFKLSWISSSKLMVTPVSAITVSISATTRPMTEWTCSRTALIENFVMNGRGM